MRFSVYQVSRKGGREKNEDRMGYCYTRDAGLFALADGMGGYNAGEVASRMATTLPGTHVVVMGVERLVPTFADLEAILGDLGTPKYRVAQLYDGLWEQRKALDDSLPADDHGGREQSFPSEELDIEGLAEEVRRRVLAATGVELEWEIKRLGEAK